MASQIIQTLVTELTADGANMRSELNRTMRETQNWGDRTMSLAKKVGGALAAGYGIKTFSSFIKGSIDSADALNDLSQSVGVSVEELSKLKYASDLNGTNFESLTGGMKKLNNAIADASKGSGAQADAFDALGISVTNADGSLRSADDVFMDLAGSFSRFEDGATKSSLAVDIFGKSGADLIPMLNAGRDGIKASTDEAERFGLVVTTEAAKAAGDFNDSLDKMNKSLDGFANKIAGEVVGDLAKFTDVINDPENQRGLVLMAQGLIEFSGWAVRAAAGIGDLGKNIGEYFARMQGYTDGGNIKHLRERLVELNDAFSFADGAFLTEDLKEKFTAEKKIIESQIKFYEDNLKKLDAWQEDDPFGVPQSSKKFQEDKTAENAAAEAARIQRERDNKKAREDGLKALQEEQKKLNELILKETEAMQERLTLGTDATELQKIQYRELNGDLKNATDAQKQKLEGLASELDMQKQMLELGEWAKEQYREKASLEELLMTDVERVNKLWDARIAKIKTLGYDEAKANEMIAKAEAGRKEDLDEKGKKGVDDLSEYSKQAARNMQSAFADFLFDPFEDGLDGLAKNFAKILQRMAAEWAAAQIFNGLGDWGKSNSGSGGLLGAAASIFGGMFAEGGRPPIGKISVVGDGGEPELFVPDTAGTIIPFSKLGGGGGSNISIGHMSFPGVTNAREAEMAAGAAARKMLGIMSSAQRYS